MSEVKRYTNGGFADYAEDTNGEWVRVSDYLALEAERDTYRKALETIEVMDTDFALGVDENMGRVRMVAMKALEGVSHE